MKSYYNNKMTVNDTNTQFPFTFSPQKLDLTTFYKTELVNLILHIGSTLKNKNQVSYLQMKMSSYEENKHSAKLQFVKQIMIFVDELIDEKIVKYHLKRNNSRQ